MMGGYIEVKKNEKLGETFEINFKVHCQPAMSLENNFQDLNSS